MNPVPALVISPRDNVATALEPLDAGQTIDPRRPVDHDCGGDAARSQDRLAADSAGEEV